MPGTSLYNPVIWEEWYFYFFLPRTYNSFHFLLQSYFITELIKTDERGTLVIFMFLIERLYCIWLLILGAYNDPVKKDTFLYVNYTSVKKKLYKGVLNSLFTPDIICRINNLPQDKKRKKEKLPRLFILFNRWKFWILRIVSSPSSEYQASAQTAPERPSFITLSNVPTHLWPRSITSLCLIFIRALVTLWALLVSFCLTGFPPPWEWKLQESWAFRPSPSLLYPQCLE